MKSCPTCGTTYSDELTFCLHDGTGLVPGPTSEIGNARTEVYRRETDEEEDISLADTLVSVPKPAVPAPKQFQMSALTPGSRTGCILTIGQVSAVLVLVVGLGLFGAYFLSTGAGDMAYTSPPPGDDVSGPATSYNTSANSAGPVPSDSAANNPSQTANVGAGGPKTVNRGNVNSLAIDLRKPALPPEARAAGVAGKVEVRVLIDETGRPISVEPVSGHPLLIRAAVEAARSTRFRPEREGGKPVRLTGILVVEFVP